jgi:chemotaxis protein MotB
MIRQATGGTIRTTVEYWPAFVDILMTVLMVFVLQNLLQTSLNIGSLESAKIRQAQSTLQQALERDFQSEIRDGTINIVVGINLLQVRFSDKILFSPTDHKLKPKGQQIVDRCALTLARIPSILYDRIQVEGHTDRAPFQRKEYPSNNWELSTARALTVVERFRSHSLAQDKLSAVGYAEFRPIFSRGVYNPDLSRRIELRLVFMAPADLGSAR